MQITTIGLDLAKHVFQVHAVDAAGGVVLRKALRRSQLLPFFAKLPPCLIGIAPRRTSFYRRFLSEMLLAKFVIFQSWWGTSTVCVVPTQSHKQRFT
jgi:hypothetical protein